MRIAVILVIAIAPVAIGEEHAQDGGETAVDNAIADGLARLARNQNSKGSFGNGSADVATSSLAGLAFLSGGHTPTRGRYAKNIRKLVKFLLRNCSRRGYINEGGAYGRGGSGMHGHGLAVLFLASAYGMTGREPPGEDLKEKLQRAIRLTEQTQSRNGGWNYEPRSSGEEGSVTITQVAGLRAARNAGLAVDPAVIRRAIRYIEGTTDNEGWVQYSWAKRSRGMRSITVTAKGASVLTYLGKYESSKLEKMMTNIMKNLSSTGRRKFYWLSKLYIGISCHQAGGKYWKKFREHSFPDILRQRSKGGGWKNGKESSSYGNAFGTACALIVLQLPRRLLPIFQSPHD